MRLLDKLRGREKVNLSQTDRYRMIPADKSVTADQEKMNRDLMEAEVTASRAKRDADNAAK